MIQNILLLLCVVILCAKLLGSFFENNTKNKGTETTNNPVIKPELEAEI